MNIKTMANYSRLDRLKGRLIRKKIWFTSNFFLIMPGYSWFLFVYLYPRVQAAGNASLQSWYEFWIWIAIIAHIFYGIYIFIGINDLRERIRCIEDDIDYKMR